MHSGICGGKRGSLDKIQRIEEILCEHCHNCMGGGICDKHRDSIKELLKVINDDSDV